MKITFVMAHADMSGGTRVIATHARQLMNRGHEVLVISTPPARRGLRARATDLLGLQKTTPEPSHFDGCDLPHHVLARFRPVTDVDVPDGDAVIATWWETAPWVANLSSSKGAKAYLLQHYETWGGDPEKVDATWRLPLHKIVISRWLAGLAREKFGDSNFSLVPNAVDTQLFHAPLRSKQAIPTIGMMYSTTPFKGCDIGLAAIAQARRTIPNLRLVAFGNEPPAEHMPLPTGTDYTLRPPQEKIRDIYARCDAWLVASRSEGFGLPILEAMACRTPVISTPAGAAPELLEGGGGILVRPEDAEDMAAAIARIVGMLGQEWQGMSDTAVSRASRYSWEDAGVLMEKALVTANKAGF